MTPHRLKGDSLLADAQFRRQTRGALLAFGEVPVINGIKIDLVSSVVGALPLGQHVGCGRIDVADVLMAVLRNLPDGCVPIKQQRHQRRVRI